MADLPPAGRERLDKWLWAARFFKTRSLAAEAISAGHVDVNGKRAKPAKLVVPGDVLNITKTAIAWTVEVVALTTRRGNATDAAMLYEETAESRQARELRREQAVAAKQRLGDRVGGRPSKRDRRRMERDRRTPGDPPY